jgi:hypothetical protein
MIGVIIEVVFKKGRQKKILLLTFLFLACTCIRAQEKTKGGFVAISAGPAFTTGKFGSKTYDPSFLNNRPAGLGKTGEALTVSGGYYLNRSCGLFISLGGQTNRQDPAAFNAYLKKQYGDSIQTNIETREWKIAKILAGGFFELPLSASGKMFLQSKIAAGLAKTTVPAYSYTTKVNPWFYTATAQSEISLHWSFAWQVNAGLGLRMNKDICLLLDLAYFDSRPAWKYSYYPNFPNTDPAVSAKRKYNLASLQLLAGIAIKLGG